MDKIRTENHLLTQKRYKTKKKSVQKYFVRPKITKIQILTLKFHFFTNFANFSQKAIFFNYALPKIFSDHNFFPKVENKHAFDPKMPKFGIFSKKIFKLYFQIISIYLK